MVMTLHRTPLHHEALNAVLRKRVVWWPADPTSPVPHRSPGFAHADGRRLDHTVLVALYELRAHQLIRVAGEVASVTPVGGARLAEWDATKGGDVMRGLAVAAVVGAT